MAQSVCVQEKMNTGDIVDWLWYKNRQNSWENDNNNNHKQNFSQVPPSFVFSAHNCLTFHNGRSRALSLAYQYIATSIPRGTGFDYRTCCFRPSSSLTSCQLAISSSKEGHLRRATNITSHPLPPSHSIPLHSPRHQDHRCSANDIRADKCLHDYQRLQCCSFSYPPCGTMDSCQPSAILH